MAKLRHNISILAVALFAVVGLFSCSEADDEIEEFPNWVATNEAYFNRLSDSVASVIAANPSQGEWRRIKCWSLQDSVAGKNSDYILAKVVSSAPATETESPLYTDTVTVHYVGKLIPSTTYSNGYEFDRSYYEPFDEEISVPSQFAVSGVVDGFATAVQNMRRGDHWIVYVPYQLGYGSTTTSGIEGGSTLIFDIRLADFWSPSK